MQRQNEIDEAFGRSVRHRRVTIVFTTLAVLLVLLGGLNLCIGSLNVPLSELLPILTGQGVESTNYQVIWNIRLPRLIAAAVLGGALALAGFLLQTFFNNPIAGPFILGISSGAKLVVALVMIVVVGGSGVMTSGMMIVSAFVGSLIAMLFVLLVSRRINSMSMLIVAGVMENMSAAPYALPDVRYGKKMDVAMGTQGLVDTMVKDGLWDAFNNYHMGTTAENICDIWGITRREQVDRLTFPFQK